MGGVRSRLRSGSELSQIHPPALQLDVAFHDPRNGTNAVFLLWGEQDARRDPSRDDARAGGRGIVSDLLVVLDDADDFKEPRSAIAARVRNSRREYDPHGVDGVVVCPFIGARRDLPSGLAFRGLRLDDCRSGFILWRGGGEGWDAVRFLLSFMEKVN